MLKRGLHIVLSAWLAILLLFGTTPKDFIHVFADHKDTVHTQHQGFVLEKQHHHCTFLSFSLTVFDNDQQLPFVARLFTEHHGNYIITTERSVNRSVVYTALRGPPVV